jgi:RNA polymerase sigma factor (sigma-70 family)
MLFIKSGKGSSKSDDELISAFRVSRDSAIIGILFDRYSHLVFAVSMKYLKNEDDSKDTVIRVFEKLPQDLIKYEIHNFSSWLHTVTKNHCLRFLSKNKFYTVDVVNIPDVAEEDDEGFVTHYLPHLHNALNNLNSEQRICIELFYIQNLSYQELSERTGFSMNEVKSHIQNGKRNLKIILLKKTNDT